MNEGVPKVFENAKITIFKTFTLEFDEKMMVIKQQLCDNDEALNSSQSESKESENVKRKPKQLRRL